MATRAKRGGGAGSGGGDAELFRPFVVLINSADYMKF